MATKKCVKCDWKAPVLLIEARLSQRTTSSRRSPVSQSWSRLDGALLLLRIACAAVFPYHGSAILFGAFDGPGPQSFSAFLHAPAIIGYLVGLAQVSGGLAIRTGCCFALARPASSS